MTKNWISSGEAAKRLGESEEFIIRLIENQIVRGHKKEDEWEVDEAHFVSWVKWRKKPRVRVEEIFSGIRSTMLEYYKTIYAQEQAQHSATRGVLYEKLIRDFLRDFLPQRFYVGSGQVLSSHPASDTDGFPQYLSRQTDIVIFDNFNHPVLLPNYELFPIEGVLAVIEVKSKLQKTTLVGTKKEVGALANIESTKRLISSEARALMVEPRCVNFQGETYDLRDMPPPLGIIFAFDSIKPKDIAEYWQEWNTSKETRYRTDMICLLKKQVLIFDTNRFDYFFDSYQIPQYSPIPTAAKRKPKLVAIQNPHVLFFFTSFLLRELRKMSAFSQELVATTPSSYLYKTPLPRPLFSIDSALHSSSDWTEWIEDS